MFAYSDLSHTEVMHKASLVLAAGADFRLLGPRVDLAALAEAGGGRVRQPHRGGQEPDQPPRVLGPARRRPAGGARAPPDALRRPRGACGSSASPPSPTSTPPTRPSRSARSTRRRSAMGIVTWAGVDYEAILAGAEREADVIVWDGGNNDLPFFRPDLMVTVVDPLRAGDELTYHPGETCVRLADVDRGQQGRHRRPGGRRPGAGQRPSRQPRRRHRRDRQPGDRRRRAVARRRPRGGRGGRPDADPRRHGLRCRSGGRPPGRRRPRRPAALRRRAWSPMSSPPIPRIEAALPAVGYSPEQLADLERSIDAVPCDAVLAATPIDLGRIVSVRRADPPGRLLGRGAPTRIADLDPRGRSSPGCPDARSDDR